jgi:hypothetical protein
MRTFLMRGFGWGFSICVISSNLGRKIPQKAEPSFFLPNLARKLLTRYIHRWVWRGTFTYIACTYHNITTMKCIFHHDEHWPLQVNWSWHSSVVLLIIYALSVVNLLDFLNVFPRVSVSLTHLKIMSSFSYETEWYETYVYICIMVGEKEEMVGWNSDFVRENTTGSGISTPSFHMLLQLFFITHLAS